MINDKIYNLLLKILESRLDPKSQDEIVRFYLLPRNTPIRPLLELPDEEATRQLGSVRRPDSIELRKRQDPEYREEVEAMEDTFSGVKKGR